MSSPENPVTAKPVPWYLDNRFVFVMLFVFGPLALPLVWLSPKFSVTWKIVTTVLAVVITALLMKTSMEMFQFLNQRLKDIRDASTM